MEFVNEVLQDIVVAVVQILLPVLIGYVVIYVNAAKEDLKVRMGNENYAYASELARTITLSAEQMGLTGKLNEMGKEKLDFAIERMESILLKRGIKMDIDEITDLIEAQVHENFKE